MILNKGLVSKELEIFLKSKFSTCWKVLPRFLYVHAIAFERLYEQNREEIDNYLLQLKVFMLYAKYNC